MHSIVLVDDHPAMVLALRSVLEQDAALKVVGSAGNGGEGLKFCRELRPDLLILDIDIPGLNGLDVVRRIRATDLAVKILIVSGYSAELFAPRCQAAGANGYVSKSEDVTNVVSAAKAVLVGYNCFRSDVCVPAAGDSADAAIGRLTQRELTVLRYLAKGDSNKQVGEALSLSNKTISTHKANIQAKLGLSNVVDLAAFARAHQLL
jgi:two-component system response regulator EvgA